MDSKQKRTKKREKRKELEKRNVPFMDDGKTIEEVEIVDEEKEKKISCILREKLKHRQEIFCLEILQNKRVVEILKKRNEK